MQTFLKAQKGDWGRKPTVRFVVSVRGATSKKSAKLAVLCAFAKRQPDGCEFYISDYPNA